VKRPRTSDRPRCRRCGKGLSPVYGTVEIVEEQTSLAQVLDPSATPDRSTRSVRGELVGYGYAATGYFCSLTCGHWAAVDALRKGATS